MVAGPESRDGGTRFLGVVGGWSCFAETSVPLMRNTLKTDDVDLT